MVGSPLAVVVLAAGEGTRMRSSALPKVLHGFAGRTLLGHVLAAAAPLAARHTLVVVGNRREQVTAHLRDVAPEAVPVVQDEQRGTGHAVRLALAALPADAPGTVVVLPGDTPLLTPATLQALLETHGNSPVTLLTSELDDPSGYGRVLRDGDGTVVGVVEHKDADAVQREVREVATAVYAFDHALLRGAVAQLSSNNAQGEEYLPDVVAILARERGPVTALVIDQAESAGVNDRVQLAAAHRAYNTRLLDAHMRGGVTVIDPATTWVDAGVTLAPDVTLLPSTDLHGATEIAAGAVVGPQVSLTDTIVGASARIERTVALQAEVGAGATVGPFAYLRPGTMLGEGVHVGTYVEIKNAEVGEGTKIPHLSYVGDATIGDHTNIGAATVFVNYDGVAKHRSVIGSHARTGADNMFVAPVEIGDGAYTAAGSVITHDVPPGAMAVARARQRNVAGWVAAKRAGTPAAQAADAAVRAATDATDAEQPSAGSNPDAPGTPNRDTAQ